MPTPYGWKRRKRTCPAPLVVTPAVRSTLKAGVPAGTRKKKVFEVLRPIVPLTVCEKPLPAVKAYGATTVFIVWYSVPGDVGSSRLSTAEWMPTLPTLTWTGTWTASFFPSVTVAGDEKVPSLPTHERL